jgi:carboxylesterase type B
MIGTNTHEGSLFYALTFLMYLPKVDEILYKSVLKIAFPDIPQEKILALYPMEKYHNLKDALIDVHTDSLWLSSAIILAEKLGAHDIPTFVYQFSQEPSKPAMTRNLGMLGNVLGFVMLMYRLSPWC